jgi:BirA family biotin operon repressor/biotin-[acetyl-CoA-carboxylase] ligase
MSVIVYPRIPAEAAGRLGALLALATAESVSDETGTQVDVRWPNDVLIGGRKVGGVLAETEVSGAEIAAAVLSVGLNVNLSPGDLPAEVKGLATTLLSETGRAHSLSRLAARLLEALEAIWPAVRGDGRALAARWRQRDALRGRKVRVETAGKTILGRAEGIDDRGHLELLTDGVNSTIPAGELISVRETQE